MKPWDERTAFMATSKWYKHNLSGLCQSKNDICPWPLSTPLTDPDLVGAWSSHHNTRSCVWCLLWNYSGTSQSWYLTCLGRKCQGGDNFDSKSPGLCWNTGHSIVGWLSSQNSDWLSPHLIVQHQTWKIRARPIRHIILSRRKVQFVLNTSVSSSVTIYYV